MKTTMGLFRKIATYTYEVLCLDDGAHYPSMKRHGYIVLHEDRTNDEIEEMCRKHLLENFEKDFCFSTVSGWKDPGFIGVRIVGIHVEEFVDTDMDLLIEGPAKDYVNIDFASQKEAEEAWMEVNKRVNGE
jgi:hypothetical protein